MAQTVVGTTDGPGVSRASLAHSLAANQVTQHYPPDGGVCYPGVAAHHQQQVLSHAFLPPHHFPVSVWISRPLHRIWEAFNAEPEIWSQRPCISCHPLSFSSEEAHVVVVARSCSIRRPFLIQLGMPDGNDAIKVISVDLVGSAPITHWHNCMREDDRHRVSVVQRGKWAAGDGRRAFTVEPHSPPHPVLLAELPANRSDSNMWVMYVKTKAARSRKCYICRPVSLGMLLPFRCFASPPTYPG